MNVLARKDQVGPAERRTAPVPRRGLEWVRVAFVGRCIQRASIPQVRPVHVRECRDVLASELRAQGWVQRPEWRRRLAQAIAQRGDMPNGVAETTATKSRRKVQ